MTAPCARVCRRVAHPDDDPCSQCDAYRDDNPPSDLVMAAIGRVIDALQAVLRDICATEDVSLTHYTWHPSAPRSIDELPTLPRRFS